MLNIKDKVKNSKYLIIVGSIILLVIAIIMISFLTRSQASPISQLDDPILEIATEEPEDPIETEEYPEVSENQNPEQWVWRMGSRADMPTANDLEQMTERAEIVVIGSFTEFVTSFNSSRRLGDPRYPSTTHHNEAMVYSFHIDEVLKGDISRGEISPNVISIAILQFDRMQGYLDNTVYDDDWNVIEEPTEFDPYSIDVIRQFWIEPIIGETVMLFLNFVESRNEVEDIGSRFAIWGHPYMIAFDSEGVAELRSNGLIPLAEREPQVFFSEGGQRIEYIFGSNWVLEDTISNLPLEEIVTTIAEITGVTPPSTSMAVTTNNATIEGNTATLTASLANNNGRVGFGFYWGTTNTPNNRVNVGVTSSSSQSFTFNLANLVPNTTYYFRAFAGASRGEVVSFTTQEMLPGQSTFSVTPDDFISIFETDRNTREWQVTFWVTETFGDGSQNRFTTDFIIPGPNANLRGSYAFADDHILAGYIIVFDIRNNGSNIVTFMLFHNHNPAGAELRMAYLTIESTDYLE